MPYADWAGVTRDLSAGLGRLEDCEFLVLGEPAREAEPRRRLLRRRRRPTATRFVQVLRIGDVLSAECVGAVSLGGSWEMDDLTIERLCRLGWSTPAQGGAEPDERTPNFAMYADLDDASGLPGLLVASLTLLGALPTALVLESSGCAEQVG